MVDLFRLLSGRSARSKRATPATFRPSLEALEDRSVPSASPTLVDLTVAGAEEEVNGALFRQTDNQPTGTGNIHSFVRLQANGKNAVAEGVNTDARPLKLDENKSPVFTRSLQLGEVPVVTIDGTAYREFLLDINQKASSPILSLDELRIYVGGSGDLSGYNATTKKFATLSAVYDLDATQNNSVMLNARLNHGSGSGDMFLYVPNAVFSSGGNYLYLYSKFGMTATSNGGFEEWAVRTHVAPLPLATISGFVYFEGTSETMNHVRDAGDTGMVGVTIRLQGINDLGQTVDIETTTDGNGYYSFGGLRAGTYTITEFHPPDVLDSAQNVGTVNGEQDGDPTLSGVNMMFTEIIMPFGAIGSDYNFGHFLELDSNPPLS